MAKRYCIIYARTSRTSLSEAGNKLEAYVDALDWLWDNICFFSLFFKIFLNYSDWNSKFTKFIFIVMETYQSPSLMALI